MRALIIDCETTGLVLNQTVRRDIWPEVIEFASQEIDWDTGELLESYSTLIKPRRTLASLYIPKGEKSITEITGITDAMLADQPCFSDISEDIRKRIESTDIVVAHNASFDKEVIDMEYVRLDQEIRWPRVLCSVEQTIGIKGFRLNLGLLHEHLFGLAHKDAHRAGTDVSALTRVVIELRRRDMI